MGQRALRKIEGDLARLRQTQGGYGGGPEEANEDQQRPRRPKSPTGRIGGRTREGDRRPESAPGGRRGRAMARAGDGREGQRGREGRARAGE
eukprot:10126982-Lingulodinium_polyedra.AAC.1